MTTPPLRLNRDQLASFLKDHRQIRAFENLFSIVEEVEASGLIGTLIERQDDQHTSIETDYIDLPVNAPHVTKERRIQWNDDDGTVDIGLYNGSVLQVGQEIVYYAKNSFNGTIANGTPVMFSGTVGASGKLEFDKAVADGSVPTEYMMGVATQDIAKNEFGYITHFGLVRGFNTTGTPYGEVWNDGDLLYFDPATPGTWTNVQPEAPNLKIPVAVVINAGSGGSGSIFVRMQTEESLNDLQDVQITDLANDDILTYNGDTERWENANQLRLRSGTLGEVTGNTVESLNLTYQSANTDQLKFRIERQSDGADWTTAAHYIYRQVDATPMGFIKFGNQNSDLITFGEATTEYMYLDGSGKLGIGKAPDTTLDILSDNAQITLTDSTTSAVFNLNNNLSGGGVILSVDDTSVGSSPTLQVRVSGTETMRVLPGAVGINNSAPPNVFSVGAIENSTADQLGTVGIKSDANDKALMLQEAVGTEQWEIGVDVDGDLNFYNSGSVTPSVSFQDDGSINFSGSLTVSGEIFANGGIALPDNQKATFGTSDDLQIYHDGSSSYIQDVGTGDLWLAGNQVRIANSDGSRTNLYSVDGGAVSIRYSGNEKIGTTATGVNVTGTLVADGLTVDGVARIQGTATGLVINETDTTDLNSYLSVNGGVFKLLTVNDAFNSFTNRFSVNNSTGDIIFYKADGATTGVLWDVSANNLDITGTVTADGATITGDIVGTTLKAIDGTEYTQILDYGVEINRANGYLRPTTAFDGTANLLVGNSANRWNIITYASDNAVQFTDGTDLKLQILAGGDTIFYDDLGVEGMRWDSSAQRLGIGTSSPQTPLHVEGLTRISEGGETAFYGGNYVRVFNSQAYQFRNSAGSAIAQINLSGNSYFNGGNVGISNSSPAYDLHIGDGTSNVTLALQSGDANESRINLGDATNAAAGSIVYGNPANEFTFRRGSAIAYEISGYHRWYTAGGVRAMDLDSSGRLGIDNSSPVHLLSVGAITASGSDQLGNLGVKSDANDKAIMIQEASGTEQWEIGVDADGDLNFYNSGSTTPSVQFLDAGGIDVTGEIAANGGVAFGDNDKATFGAGSDLQIYHSGTNSFIQEQGTGDLYITTNGSKIDMMTNGLTEYGVRIFQDGEVSLYHNGSAKLATTATGIDVTGTVTADGLSVDSGGSDTNAYISSSANNRLKFSTTGQTAYDVTLQQSYADEIFSIKYGTSGGKLLSFQGFSTPEKFYLYNNNTLALSAVNNDISFYEDTGTTAKFFWDASAESLGIGTTSPVSYDSVARNLVLAGASDAGMTIASGTASAGNLVFADGTIGVDAYRGILKYDHASDAMSFFTNGVRNMTIDSAGNVGIGTASPQALLDVSGGDARINSYALGRGSGGSSTNTVFGLEALDNNTSGTQNTAIGKEALRYNTTGPTNTAVGSEALKNNTTGSVNTAVGAYALRYNTTGVYNTSFGYSALQNNNGNSNVAVGDRASNSNTSGDYNVSVGRYALNENTTGGYNVSIGAFSLRRSNANYNTAVGYSALAENTTGTQQTALGMYALNFTTSGYYNTATGMYAGYKNTTGALNVFNGRSAGFENTTGSYNTLVGYNAGGSLTTGSNNTIIGGVAGTAGLANTIIIGAGTTERLRVDDTGALGINTSTPTNSADGNGASRKLMVNGDISVDAGDYIALDDSYRVHANLRYDSSAGDEALFKIQGYYGFDFITRTSSRVVIKGDTGYVGVNTSSPSTELEVAGVIRASDGTEYTDVRDYGIEINRGIGYLRPISTFNGTANLQVGNSGNLWNIVSIESDNSFQVTDGTDKRFEVQAGADAIFYDNVGVEGMRWDSSAQRLGIGISNPIAKLQIASSGNNARASTILTSAESTFRLSAWQGTTGANTLVGDFGLEYNGTKNATIKFYRGGSTTGGELAFTTNNDTERARLDSSGNLLVGKSSTGIGTTGVELSPSGYIYGTRNGNSLALNRLSTDGAIAVFQKDGTNVGSIGTGNSGRFYVGQGDTGLMFDLINNAVYPWNTTTNNILASDAVDLGYPVTGLRFKDIYLSGTAYATTFSGSGASLTNVNAATLDSLDSTQFLRSDTSDTMNGNLTVTNDLTAGESFFGATSYKVRINSTSSTGILEFNSTNGVIRNTGTVLGLAASSTQIVDVRAAAMQPTTDNVTDLGASTKRWDNIYATNGTIQTSDGNEKQDIEALSDAELRVAQSIKGLIRKFRFKSAVAEKGEDARIHFGVIAQDVKTAFEAEGLDAGQYGCFCADVDEDGNDRLGIRYDELLAFVIAAL